MKRNAEIDNKNIYEILFENQHLLIWRLCETLRLCQTNLRHTESAPYFLYKSKINRQKY